MRSLAICLLLLACARAEGRLTQAEAQDKFDAAVSAADEIVVFDYAVRRADESVYLVEVWTTNDPAEVRALSGFVRIQIEPGAKPWRCGCDGSFTVTLRHKHKPISEFRVYHPDAIACRLVDPNSHVHIDEVAFAPFWKRIAASWNRVDRSIQPDAMLIGSVPRENRRDIKKWANQPPEPTVMSVTPRADARVAPALAVAHL